MMSCTHSRLREPSSVNTMTRTPKSQPNGTAAPLPKYYQLRETLREQIELLQSGQPIPSENELCLAHDVSRITVRKALNDLVHQGLLYTVQGKGTFVAPHKFRVQWAQETAGFHADMARRGLSVRVRVLEQTLVPADERVATELSLNLGAPVVKLVRLRYVDDKPFDIATNYLPAQLFPGLEREDLTTASLYALMQSKYGIQLDHGVRLAEAALCLPEEAKLLRIKTTVPLLVIHSTMFDVNDRPVEHGIAKQRGDRAQVEIAVVAAK
jgi:GntR family transcriptional regulator